MKRMKFLGALVACCFYGMLFCAITSCGQSITDDRDGQSYGVVQIGSQLWMAENLNFAGDAAGDAFDKTIAAESFCPEGDNRNCKKYGRLYTWNAAQNACPAGWRLPTADEFNAMFLAVAATDTRGAAMAQATNITTVGKLLKSTSGWFKNGNGIDAVGFAALPAGYMAAAESSDNQSDSNQPAVGKFDGIGGYAYFWSSTLDAVEPAFAHYLFLDFSSPAAEMKSFDKNSARSVRCVKN
ncbi:major paralogous domain-containing protein [Fibrobacter sp. UWH9]|nr:major paralogous domain-containing protein [Fibrobacter sp. UWH9]